MITYLFQGRQSSLKDGFSFSMKEIIIEIKSNCPSIGSCGTSHTILDKIECQLIAIAHQNVQNAQLRLWVAFAWPTLSKTFRHSVKTKIDVEFQPNASSILSFKYDSWIPCAQYFLLKFDC